MNNSNSSNDNRQFVIEFLDLESGCLKSSYKFSTNDISSLCAIIDPDVSDIPNGLVYDLDETDLAKLACEFKIVLNEEDAINSPCSLRAWRLTDGLPYEIHTGRELKMMLSGKKPLAVFSEYWPNSTGYEFIPERHFAQYVADGTFSQYECIDTDTKMRRARYVLFAVKGEEWRFNAYIMMRGISKKVGWNEGFERMEGELLGYEEWQNDAFIEMIYKPGLGV
ncbi:MAG: hypothetical protein RL748_1493 [Pseudomonadota bacterium]|jgi:hypothetical protein